MKSDFSQGIVKSYPLSFNICHLVCWFPLLTIVSTLSLLKILGRMLLAIWATLFTACCNSWKLTIPCLWLRSGRSLWFKPFQVPGFRRGMVFGVVVSARSGCCYLKSAFRCDARQFLQEFVYSAISTVVAWSVLGARTSCFCLVILICGDEHASLELVCLFPDGFACKAMDHGLWDGGLQDRILKFCAWREMARAEDLNEEPHWRRKKSWLIFLRRLVYVLSANCTKSVS